MKSWRSRVGDKFTLLDKAPIDNRPPIDCRIKSITAFTRESTWKPPRTVYLENPPVNGVIVNVEEI